MSDDFCYHSKCRTEVESIYIFRVDIGYEPIPNKSYCSNCKEVVNDTETYWRHVEYHNGKVVE
jgi:hypothetical protein